MVSLTLGAVSQGALRSHDSSRSSGSELSGKHSIRQTNQDQHGQPRFTWWEESGHHFMGELLSHPANGTDTGSSGTF